MTEAGAGGEGGASVVTCSGPLSIEGRVTTPSGAPLAGVQLIAEQLGASAESFLTEVARATSDANGRYAIAGLCGNLTSYRVSPSLAGYSFCSGPEDVTLDAADDVTQAFTANPGECEGNPLERRVRAVVYDPFVATDSGGTERLSKVLGVEDPYVVLFRFVFALNTASNGHVHYVAVVEPKYDAFPEQEDGFRYDAQSYAACRADPQACHTPELANYTNLVGQNNLCSSVEIGDSDELWIVGAPHFGFVPWQTANCMTRTPDVTSFDYTGGLSGMFASFQARSESVLKLSYDAAQSSAFSRFSQVQSQTDAATSSGCGSTTYAPNASQPNRFDDPAQVPSYCDAYFRYPAALDVVGKLGCEAWGCTELGYRRYWFSHLPRARWLDSDNQLADFWRTILRPEDRRPLRQTSCSSTYAVGWCDHLIDGIEGVCNENEWAASGPAPQWAELEFVPPRSLVSVELFDRACVEQVRSGHVEFSDGSPDVPFGPLNAEGKPGQGTLLRFETAKLLSGLRVVLDSTTGSYPGLGEIVVR